MDNYEKYDKINAEMEIIINNITSQLSSRELDELFESIDSDEYDNSYLIKPPIYYLFDGYINENIGSNNEIRDNLNDLFGINKNFLLIDNNDKIESTTLFNIEHPSHSTLFNLISVDGRYYIYYSNSGLGIDNNHIILDKSVVPKIYYIENPQYGNEYDIITNYMNIIYMCIFYSYARSEIKRSERLNRQKQEEIEKLNQELKIENGNNPVNKEKIDKINENIRNLESENTPQKLFEFINDYIHDLCDEINIPDVLNYDDVKLTDQEDENLILKNSTSDAENIQELIYAIINFTIHKFSNININIQECTFNHVLIGTENHLLTKHFNLLSKKTRNNCKTLTDFINNKS